MSTLEKAEKKQHRNTLTKWGNGQGIRIPKSICERMGVQVGDPYEISITPDNVLAISFPTNKYARRRRVTIEDLLKGYSKNAIFEPEEGWGEDVGAEVVE